MDGYTADTARLETEAEMIARRKSDLKARQRRRGTKRPRSAGDSRTVQQVAAAVAAQNALKRRKQTIHLKSPPFTGITQEMTLLHPTGPIDPVVLAPMHQVNLVLVADKKLKD
jgi:hypothetical protein